ncbi:hypothetical protein [Rhodanobacter sp. Root561]|nr:hypothetical protein [Rhodanobacter sp. Root561]
MSNSNSLSEYLVLSRGRWDRDVSREDINKKVSETMTTSAAD